jgi:hypothetical protein
MEHLLEENLIADLQISKVFKNIPMQSRLFIRLNNLQNCMKKIFKNEITNVPKNELKSIDEETPEKSASLFHTRKLSKMILEQMDHIIKETALLAKEINRLHDYEENLSDEYSNDFRRDRQSNVQFANSHVNIDDSGFTK